MGTVLVLRPQVPPQCGWGVAPGPSVLPAGLRRGGLPDLTLPPCGQPPVWAHVWPAPPGPCLVPCRPEPECRPRPRLPFGRARRPRSRGALAVLPKVFACSLPCCITQLCCVTRHRQRRGLKQHLFIVSQLLWVGSPACPHWAPCSGSHQAVLKVSVRTLPSCLRPGPLPGPGCWQSSVSGSHWPLAQGHCSRLLEAARRTLPRGPSTAWRFAPEAIRRRLP